MKVKIEEISSNTKFFTREEISEDLIEHYSDLIDGGITLPAITVFEDPDTKKYSILDGFHTYHAALKAGVESIDIEITNKETELDRLIEGIKKNSLHGKPLSTKDRRRNIERILTYEASWEWSNQVIASIVGTSDRTVANVKKSHPSPKISEMEGIKCFRNGKLHFVKANQTSSKADESTGDASAEETSAYSSQVDVELENLDSAPSEDTAHETKILSEDQKFALINLMKELQYMCVGYTKMFNLVNDGSEEIDLFFLDKLESRLLDVQAHIAKITNLVAVTRIVNE